MLCSATSPRNIPHSRVGVPVSCCVCFSGQIWKLLVDRISARCRAERPRLADIRQHPLEVFSQPYQVVFISRSETGQARREFLSRCQSSGCTSVSPVLYKSCPVPYRVSLQYTGSRRWWPTVSAPVTPALTESYRLHLIVSIKLSPVASSRECKSPKLTDTTLNISAYFLDLRKNIMLMQDQNISNIIIWWEMYKVFIFVLKTSEMKQGPEQNPIKTRL